MNGNAKCNELYSLAKQAVISKDSVKARLALIELLQLLDKEYLSAADSDKAEFKKVINFFLNLCAEIRTHGFTNKVLEAFSLPVNNLSSFAGTCNGRDISKSLIDALDDDPNKSEAPKSPPILTPPTAVSEEPRIAKTNKNDLRPKTLKEYIGQEEIKESLSIAIKAAKTMGEMLNHILLFGSAGLGKTTLAIVIANEMNSKIQLLNGPQLTDINSLVKFFTQIKSNTIVFIDEIHRAGTAALEALYGALTDFKITYMDAKGNNVSVDLPDFTLIGATTHSGMLQKPMLDRCHLQYNLTDYTVEEREKLVEIKAKTLGYTIATEAVKAIANRSRGVPRIIERFILGLRNLAINADTMEITEGMCAKYFENEGIDAIGLTKADIKLLNALIDTGGAPVGLNTLSGKTDIQDVTIEGQYEPYLLKLGFIEKQPKGRVCTKKAYDYLGIPYPFVN
jgi:Holliday junction DNA helicase RuvB